MEWVKKRFLAADSPEVPGVGVSPLVDSGGDDRPEESLGGIEAMKITDKNSARRYKRDHITSYLLVSNEGTGARSITTSLVEIENGGKQHIHSHATEQCYFILEGRGEMTVGEETVEVSAGMSIFIPSHQPHGLENTTEGILRYLSAGSPPFGKGDEVRLWPLPPLSEVPP